MRIEPNGVGQPPKTNVDRAGAPPPAPAGDSAPGPRPAANGPAPADLARISGAARELLGSAEAASGTRRLDPEREREILDRMRSGYYDRADVRQDLLRLIARDLSGA